ncbi:short-chain dehydrogenase/reductase [Xylariales sp. AK1849]|nr:short-chain dehydrogenase/reductase [Xylariales sp. AK1849]
MEPYRIMPQKTVLITGCSEGGIGASLAAEFQLQGFRVFATARDVHKMKILVDMEIETLELDVTSDSSIAAAVAAVDTATGGSLDYLVNNAGICHVVPFADSKVEDFRRVIDTNLIAVFAVTHAFLLLLMKARGVVVNMGSVSEVYHPPFSSAYTASKSAIHSMAKTLRVELEPLGVRFITVMTGRVYSNMQKTTPDEIPENSVYAPIANLVEDSRPATGTARIPADLFAKRVVGDLMKPSPKATIWRGRMSMVAWILTWFGWDGMLDSILIKRVGLDKLRRSECVLQEASC